MKLIGIFTVFLAFIIVDPLGLAEPVPVPPTPTVAVQSVPPDAMEPATDAYPGPQATATPDAYPAPGETRVFPTQVPGPAPEGEPCAACVPSGGR